MTKQLREKLKQIADMIDPEHMKSVEVLQDKLWAFKPLDRIPVVIVDVIPPEHPLYPHDEAFKEPEKILWNQLLFTYVGALMRDDRTFTVRAEYGPVIVASLFGMDYIIDKVSAWGVGFNDRSKIKEIIKKGIPDVTKNLAGKALETMKFFVSCLKEFELDRYIHVAQCDSQSAIDLTWMIWGDDIYYAMIDAPELVHGMLDIVTETIIAFINAEKKIIDFRHQWFYHINPSIRVVDDIAISLSPAMYEEFVRPYNERVFKAVENKGFVHYCGHLLHNLHSMLHSEGLYGIEIAGENTASSVPQFNLDNVWRQAYEHKIPMAYMSNNLPKKRPNLPGGLLYIIKNEHRNYNEAKEFYKKVKEFWS